MREITTVAETLDILYDDFDFADEGEDRPLMWRTDEAERSARQAQTWAEINEAREGGRRSWDSIASNGGASWDGVLLQEVYEANGETDPNLKVDALLRVAATALTYAASVTRQVIAFEEDSE